MSEDQHGIATDPRDWPKTLFYVALLFSVFQIVTAAFSPVSSIVLRAVHVGFLLWVVFLSYPAYGKQRPWQPLAWVLSLAWMIWLVVVAWQMQNAESRRLTSGA